LGNWGGQKKARSNPSTESKEKYFCQIKFSTQVLISLWKTRLPVELTSRSSTKLCGLHYSGAGNYHADDQNQVLLERRRNFPPKDSNRREKSFFVSAAAMKTKALPQYHFGGRSR
jgi:hypothetical protein